MYFVTGGTGQIGAYVVRRLVDRREKIVVFDLRADVELLKQICGPHILEHVEVIEGDASMASELVGAILKTKPKAIVHLASALPPIAERDAHYSLANVTGSMVNVLDAASLLRDVKVVWSSATSVFGRPESHGGIDKLVGDTAAHYPTSLYGITKSACERLAALYRVRHGVNSVGFRFCQGYGPGKRRGRPYGYKLFEAAITGEPCTVPYGDDIINWQYVEDIAEILVKGITAPYLGIDVYNTTGEVTTMRSAVALVKTLAPGLSATLEKGTAEIVWRYDASRLASDVGFDNPTRIADGFRMTLDTMRAWRNEAN
ncbi:MAG: NAD(P)-dependent oxidoreductase [Proteobacteria bacterium]|nr:NAD(P)-dependent oxidoreductase [Pseudomonadota bacterium]